MSDTTEEVTYTVCRKCGANDSAVRDTPMVMMIGVHLDPSGSGEWYDDETSDPEYAEVHGARTLFRCCGCQAEAGEFEDLFMGSLTPGEDY